MKSKYILYKCERGDSYILEGSRHEWEYEIIKYLFFDNRRIRRISTSYKIRLNRNYKNLNRHWDLNAIKGKNKLTLEQYKSQAGWAIEQLAAYYGKFMVLFRR